MKKLLSILCALSIMVSLSSTAYAERTEPDHDPVPEPNTIFGTDERQVVTNTSQKGALLKREIHITRNTELVLCTHALIWQLLVIVFGTLHWILMWRL